MGAARDLPVHGLLVHPVLTFNANEMKISTMPCVFLVHIQKCIACQYLFYVIAILILVIPVIVGLLKRQRQCSDRQGKTVKYKVH